METVPSLSLPINEAFLPAAKDPAAARASRPSLSYWRDGWLRLKRNKQSMISLWTIVALLAFVILGPVFWKVSSSAQELGRNAEPPTLKVRTALVVDRVAPFAIVLAPGMEPKTPGVAASDLAAPAEIKLQSIPTQEQVRIEWTAVPKASGYAIYRSTLKPDNAYQLGIPLGTRQAGNQVSYEDPADLKPITYFYSVVAKTSSGEESKNYKTLQVDIGRTLLIDKIKATHPEVKVGDILPLPARPFGTDALGRDMLSRMIEGGRVSLFFGLIAPLLSTLLGVAIGGAAGFFGGKVDTWLMRFTDFVLALPFLLFMIVFRVASGTQPGESGVIPMLVAIVVLSWTGPARLVRGQILQLRETEFVQASRLLGARPTYLIVRHLLPNTLGVILISLTFAIPSAIFTEAFLSFIGMGVVPPTPSWGQMCDEGIRNFIERPHEFFFPASFISITVLAFNLLGDGLRDAFDPRMRSIQ